MAFSTIQGSGGAPDSFVGTSGVDTISIVDGTGNFFLGAQEANDAVSFVSSNNDPGVITSATLRLGAGNDAFTTVGMAVFNGIFLNGNGGNDILNFATGLLSGSTVQGGQGTDGITITAGSNSSLINGNIGADTITANGGANSNSSLFGGQGNDSINVNVATTSSVVSGDNDDDVITTGNVNVTGTSLNGGAGNDTINASAITAGVGNSSVFADGGDGNDSIDGGALNDTLNGGSGNDSIDGNLLADIVTGGAGADQYTVAAGESVAATTVTTVADTTTATALAVGGSIRFANGVDTITDFSAANGDTGLFGGNGPAAVVYGAGGTNVSAAGDYLLRGDWSAASNTFTLSATGADSLYVNSSGTLIGANNLGTDSVLLLGTGAALAATAAAIS